MKKSVAKHASAALSASARFFVSIMKFAFHSPEAPKELQK
ncbi:hypothetical protein J2T20_002806 [Paenibacillus wynnii]|nr:hypothetical protein [Paenibacillus wynnii]